MKQDKGDTSNLQFVRYCLADAVFVLAAVLFAALALVGVFCLFDALVGFAQ